MAATSNLYPPLVDTYADSFLINSGNPNKNICRIYFALSLFNSLSQIKNAQISVRSQLTNLSVLKSSKYPCEIKLTSVQTDNTRTTADKYYVEISPDDIEGGFKINQYYKVQIRFTSIAATDPPSGDVQSIAAWLTENLSHFSEWSTVILARGISVHDLYIKDFSDGGGVTEVYSTVADIPVMGELQFTDETETDTLKSYRIKLYDNNNIQLTDSGYLYTNNYINPNEINYHISYNIEPNNSYYFTIEYTTNTLYTETLEYHFTCVEGETPDIGANFSVYLDEENGRMKVKVSRPATAATFTGQIIVRRSSSKDNFKSWEDMYAVNYENIKQADFVWYDYTIEYGVWYEYAIQGVDTSGGRSSMVKAPKRILAIFEDIFLTSGDKQIKIKFNPSIGNFKRTFSESKTDTLGSKYPYIRRNGYVNYIQFGLGGLIASAMDEDGLFIVKKDEYDSLYTKYNSYNEEHSIPFNTIDFIWEKLFREKVMNFLYDKEVKLFRSPTEGNILIKLMDISFTPNQTLGRSIWSFNSTAFEIDDCTLDNLDKYHIYTKLDDTITFSPDGGDSSLTPIQRVVFVPGDILPDEGRANVLYVFKNQLYLYNTTTNQFFIISIPYWNEGPYVIPEEPGTRNLLYTDSENVFKWNSDTDNFEIISVPTMEE